MSQTHAFLYCVVSPHCVPLQTHSSSSMEYDLPTLNVNDKCWRLKEVSKAGSHNRFHHYHLWIVGSEPLVYWRVWGLQLGEHDVRNIQNLKDWEKDQGETKTEKGQQCVIVSAFTWLQRVSVYHGKEIHECERSNDHSNSIKRLEYYNLCAWPDTLVALKSNRKMMLFHCNSINILDHPGSISLIDLK